MALINIQRFRDVLVRTQLAQDAPALEVSVGLEQELDDTLGDFATNREMESSFALLRGDIWAFQAQILQKLAEQEQRSTEREQRLVLITLSGIAVATAILGLLAVLG